MPNRVMPKPALPRSRQHAQHFASRDGESIAMPEKEYTRPEAYSAQNGGCQKSVSAQPDGRNSIDDSKDVIGLKWANTRHVVAFV